jgi:adenine-specific DNA methylase
MNPNELDRAADTVQHAASVERTELCFMETQFPVSKVSKESYAERRANQSQTITGLGKWWGRKPLVLCRAIILGLILPGTENTASDRNVFLRLMTMDDDGMLRRKSRNIPATEMFGCLGPSDRSRYFESGSNEEKAKLKKGLKQEDKDDLQRRVFLSLSYDERLGYCDRPEQIDGPSAESWRVINAHLGTEVLSLSELVVELGRRRFGHVPRVGDTFCGGGSVPFEAARLGCAVYGSDLNPVAALLTWAALNVVGGGNDVAEGVKIALREVYEVVDHKIITWGIEHRGPDIKTGRCWRADAYLYCVEVTCPECGWRVPLAPTWLVGPTSRVVVRIIPDEKRMRYNFEVTQGASDTAMKAASESDTARDSSLVCPKCKAHTPIRAIRGDGRGTFGETKSLLRCWENRDLVPREGDIFGERLYCIRWVDTWLDRDGRERSERHYCAPTREDIAREQQVLDLLLERFDGWQKQGFIPSRKIEPGYNTTQPIRERGWTHWHHLFNPRQLLVNGLLAHEAYSKDLDLPTRTALLLGVGRCADWNSRLCRWGTGAARESIAQTFSNQALDTLFTYASKAYILISGSWFPISPVAKVAGSSMVTAEDSRKASQKCDIWITDPPYADAINYEEISEFFLAWQSAQLRKLFPGWYNDSKRALAIKGSDDNFRKAMVDCYRTLAEHMPENGLQVVMFTHQDTGVWADLAVILWAAGLRVTAAWCIQTEREATGTREGNYVQGTVLLVLRKQVLRETAFLDEVYPEVEAEVRRQLDSMLSLDDMEDPNFSDTDYQLAAYAAALRVLTSKKIEEIDVNYELTRARAPGEVSPVEQVIRNAVAIACDHLVPHGIDRHLWKSLSALERFYLKGLEMESHGECRIGVYQELAKGFGVQDYKYLLASTKANQTRLKTASEFGRKELDGDGFAKTLVRQALFGIFKTIETDSTREAITWFTTEIEDYATNRARLIEILEFIATLRQNAAVVHWHKDAEAAALLAGALRNRQDNV